MSSISAQADQIPATLPAGLDVLVVVAPLQVLGAGLLDELIAPTAYRVFDAAKYSKLNPTPTQGRQGRRARRTRHAPHDRHRSRRDRSLGVRPARARSAAEAALCAQARAAAVGRRALFVGERAELLDQGQSGARAHRAVHRQRLQERDAVVHRRGRSRAVVRAAHGPLRTSAPSAWAGTTPTTRRSSSKAGTASPTRRRFCAASSDNRRC